MSISETQDEIIEEFSQFDDWMDRYSLLIEYGNGLAPFPESEKTEQNLIDGCQSRVWFTCTYQDGRITYNGESDAILVKGIIAIVLMIYNDKSPEEIKNVDVQEIFAKLGLEENLTPSRRNGMMSMVEKIRQYAENAE